MPAPPPPPLVEITRGGIHETSHRGWIAVAKADGSLVASVGDPDRVTYPRSAMKQFQGVAVVESGAPDTYGWSNTELSVCCASHSGEPRHRMTVNGMLLRAGQPISAMQNGIDKPWSRAGELIASVFSRDEMQLAQNCSGKHAGMVCACVASGFPVADYDDPEHPHQQRIREIVARFWHMAPDDLVLGYDMCTLPAYAAPLRNVATGWAGVADPDNAPAQYSAAIRRIGDAMAADPFMISGTGGLETQLMEVTKGRVLAKGGAEGVLCIAVRDRGLGIAFKVEDGSFRSHGRITLALLQQLDAISEDEAAAFSALYPTALHDNRGRHVADMQSVFELSWA